VTRYANIVIIISQNVWNFVFFSICRKLRAKVEYLSTDITGRYDSSYWYYQPVEDRIPGHVRGKHAEDKKTEGVYYPLKW